MPVGHVLGIVAFLVSHLVPLTNFMGTKSDCRLRVVLKSCANTSLVPAVFMLMSVMSALTVMLLPRPVVGNPPAGAAVATVWGAAATFLTTGVFRSTRN